MSKHNGDPTLPQYIAKKLEYRKHNPFEMTKWVNEHTQQNPSVSRKDAVKQYYQDYSKNEKESYRQDAAPAIGKFQQSINTTREKLLKGGDKDYYQEAGYDKAEGGILDDPTDPKPKSARQKILELEHGKKLFYNAPSKEELQDDFYDKNAKVLGEWSRVRDMLKGSNENYDYKDAIPLTQGRYNTGKLPKRMVDEMYKVSKEVGIDTYDLLSVAGRESTFGWYSGGKHSTPGGTKEQIVSGWDITGDYLPKTLEEFLADKKSPHIWTTKSSKGWRYGVKDDDKFEEHLMLNPHILKDYEKYLETVPKLKDNEFDYYKEVAKMIKNNQMHKYNPGDPDYQNKLAKEKELLLQEKELVKYIEELNKVKQVDSVKDLLETLQIKK